MDVASEIPSPEQLSFERHDRLRKVIGALTLVLVVAAMLAGPQYGIAFIFAAMGCFVLAAWHQVLYSRGKRQHSPAR
jgi:hypothetical protein